jgi:hypothetical protein
VFLSQCSNRQRGIRPARGGKGPRTCRERNPVLPNLVAEPTLSLWVV